MKQPIIANDQKPWEQLESEPARGYEYARTYFELGPQRSIFRLSQLVHRSTRQLKRWSVRCDWVRRAQAYDRHIAQEYAQAGEVGLRQEAEVWAKRESELRETKWVQSEMLLAQADKMLQFPLAEVERKVRVDEQGHATEIQIIHPTKWSARDVPLFAETGFRLSGEAIRNEGAANHHTRRRPTFSNVCPTKEGKAT